MKKILLILVAFYCNSLAGQTAKIINDTATYENVKYWVGKEVQLMYGSGSNKNFAFAFIGSGLSGVDPLSSSSSKRVVKIDKIDTRRGKVILRGNFSENPVALNKIFIDLEGAIDNKELKGGD